MTFRIGAVDLPRRTLVDRGGPDGSLEITSLGDTLLWNPEPPAIGLDPGIWLVENGKLSLVYDPAGDVASATLHRGTALDVCAALS